MSGHISSDHSRSASRSSQTPRLSQGQAFEPMPRQSFGRNSRVSNPNVFSDEYSLEPIDTDDQIERAPSSPASISSSTTLRSIHHPQKPVSQATTENENPFGDDARVSFEEARRSSLPQKGMGGFSTNRGSVASVNNSPFAVQRNQSVSSRFSIPRAMSPYTGATGPSHPYAMYPQVGVSRSPSVGSTSTIRQHDRPLGESTGPQHPYAMYPQNVVEEGMDDDVIPVGFPGHNPPYQPPPGRRDNDVGDIIGADGHAEPLPPYSRYPTGAVPRPPGVEIMADTHTPSETQQLHSISRDQPQPISETSTRALVPLSSRGTTAVDYDDDDDHRERRAPLTGIMAFEEKLKQKGKKTACCGMPVWTIVLVATVMLIGGSIGGAIGGVIGGKRAAEHDRQAAQSSGPQIVTVTATPQMDYSTMTSTPTNLKSVPTGHYLVPAQLQNSSRMCVEDSQFRHAWGCMDNPTNFDVVVGGDRGHHSIIFSSTGPASTFTYGAQPPILPTPTQSLGFAIDTSDTGLGPALFFFAKFDKLVIVPESQFESSSSVSARSFVGDASFLDSLHRMQTAQPGDKPWFCYWNQTMMEFFIYVNQTTAEGSSTTATTATTATDMSASTAGAQSNKRGYTVLDYPRKIKIEERRDFAGAQPPYCQQMQVGSDGHIVAIQSQVINIKEREPTPTTTYINTSGGSSQTYTAKAQYATPCYCHSTTD